MGVSRIKKIISEYVCDFCGAKCNHEGYVLPVIETERCYAKDSTVQKRAKFDMYRISPKNIDMCQDCKSKVARFINLAHYVDIQNFEDSIFDELSKAMNR